MASQINEYEITSASLLFLLLSMSHEGLNGQWLSASVTLLKLPVWYLMTKSNNAPNLLSGT